MPLPRRPSFWAVLTIALAFATAAPSVARETLTRDEVRTRLPQPEQIGDGWEWTNAERPVSDLGFQLTAYYYFRDPAGAQNDSQVVDVRVLGSASEAETACAGALRRRRAGDQVVVDMEPSLGSTGFQSHYGPHAEYGRRVTFCEKNVFVTIGPSRRGLQVAQTIRELLQR